MYQEQISLNDIAAKFHDKRTATVRKYHPQQGPRQELRTIFEKRGWRWSIAPINPGDTTPTYHTRFEKKRYFRTVFVETPFLESKNGFDNSHVVGHDGRPLTYLQMEEISQELSDIADEEVKKIKSNPVHTEIPPADDSWYFQEDL